MSTIRISTEKIDNAVRQASQDYTRIISTEELKVQYRDTLYWGGNGVGDRFAGKRFNYTVIYGNKKTEPKTYSEYEDDFIPEELLTKFLEQNREKNGIIGIYVHSVRTNVVNRPISEQIKKKTAENPCVVCGTHKTVCDHKNDLYNDERVLSKQTQELSDFQPLCEHCNLQKRQVQKTEKRMGRIYSAKNIPRYKVLPFEFPWEKKVFDTKDPRCKDDTYWYDPIEFDLKIFCYTSYVLPIVKEIKKRNRFI